MATKKIKRFQEGGMSDKERGLEASKDDKVGFFERLRMGNIDQEGSEAYNRFGAGRAKADRDMASEAAAMKAVDDSRAAPAAPNRTKLYEKGLPSHDSGAAEVLANFESATENSLNKRELGRKNDGGKYDTILPSDAGSSLGRISSVKSAPGKSSTKTAPAKAPAMQEQTHTRRGGATAEDRASSPRVAPASNPNYSNEGRGKEMSKKQQLEREIDSIKPTEEQTQKGLENAMLPGAGLKTLSAAAKKLAAGKPSKLKTYDQPALPGPAQKALPSPTKRLTYDKAGAIAKRRADRASKRRDEMLDENAKNYGLDPKAPGYEAASSAVRKEMGGKDFTFKKGGKVKPKKMSSGGSTSPASKRADGIATRGKTRCKIC